MLTGQSGYDVVVTSGSATGKLIAGGALRKLERSTLRNLGNLDPQLMQLVTIHDPGNEHAIPYLWGTTGIAYNKVRRSGRTWSRFPWMRRIPTMPISSSTT